MGRCGWRHERSVREGPCVMRQATMGLQAQSMIAAAAAGRKGSLLLFTISSHTRVLLVLHTAVVAAQSKANKSFEEDDTSFWSCSCLHSVLS